MSAPTRLAALAAPTSAPESVVTDELAELEAVAAGLEQHTHAANTRRAYDAAWRAFVAFCDEHELEPLPAHPETVRWFVAWMSVQFDEHGLPRFSIATIRQRLAGVADAHLRQGYLDPTGHRGVVDLVRGLTKVRATRPARKRPLLLEDLLRVIGAMEHDVYPAGISAARDAAALWLGWAGALRRSEVAALRLSSLELHPGDGIHVSVGRSKADQDNTAPDKVVLPFGSSPATCPPCAVHRWVALLGCSDRRAVMTQLFGYQLRAHVCGVAGQRALITGADLQSRSSLLRATYRNRHTATISADGVSGDALGTMLATRVAEAGMDSRHYGFHSLRAGHVTQARRNGAPTEEIMRQGRWRKAETVEIYDREWNPLSRNSVTRLGL